MLLNSKFVLLLIVLISCTPCQSTKSTQTTEIVAPIDVSSKNYPLFGVAKIQSALLPGTAIGAHHDGLLHLKQFYHRATGAVSDQAEGRYKTLIIEELRNAGYNTVEQSDLFGDDQSWKARLLIGASIIDAKLNTFAPLAGNYSDAEQKIEWKVYDRDHRKVIYNASISGSSKISGVSPEVIFEAFRASFRNLLSNKNYVETLNNYLSLKESQDTSTSSIEYYKNYTSPPKNIIEYVSRAVVAVKTDAGHGSGFIFNEDGYAITSYHVVEGVNTIDAIMTDGKIIQTKIIATQPEKNLAVIKLSGTGYDYLSLGDINKVAVGSIIYAIGTPVLLELSQSVSKGIVSGYRKFPKLTLVQTDASINPGNSGGPLIDEKGKVVGIVVLKLVKYDIEGLGFGISINDAIDSFNLRSNN